MKKAGLILCLLGAAASWGAAADEPSVDRGKELFNSTVLGTNGKKCSDCHPGGKGLEEAAGYGVANLRGIINGCITNPLKGKALAADSTDLASLVMYIKSLAPPAKP